jgi:FkbM family methyltransferase
MMNLVRQQAVRSVRGICRTLGFDVVRLKNIPGPTLAGLARQPFRTIVDCGANEGQFARAAVALFPEAKLFCFEPLDDPFARLSAWAATQHGRVRCFQTALGNQTGVSTMKHHTAHSPSSSLLDTTEHKHTLFPQTRPQAALTVPVTTLDIALADAMATFDPRILLKLDVQGYEDRVLKGGAQLLGRVDACVLEVDVDPLYANQARFKDLVDVLDASGLQYAGNVDQIYADDGHVMWLDALFVRR